MSDHTHYWAVFIDDKGKWSLRCLSCNEHWHNHQRDNNAK